MSKSMTVGKRENEKKRLAKRAEKLKRKEEKKLAGKSGDFADMIAYVDENGMITSTPPDTTEPTEETPVTAEEAAPAPAEEAPEAPAAEEDVEELKFED